MAKQPTNQDILNEVFRLGDLLEGDRDDRHDGGIISDVKENTDFRKSIQKFYWLFIGGIMLGNIPIIMYGSQKLVKIIEGWLV